MLPTPLDGLDQRARSSAGGFERRDPRFPSADRKLGDSMRRTTSSGFIERDNRRPPGFDDRYAQGTRRAASSGMDRDGQRRDQPREARRSLSSSGVEAQPRQMPLLDPRGRSDAATDGSRQRPVSVDGVVRVGADTLNSRGKGYVGNQDRFVHRNGDTMFFAGVFDGHGMQGDKVAEYAKESLTKEIFSRVGAVGPEKALSQGFEACSKQLEARKDVATYSGTTAVTALFPDSSSILVANCGDSRAVLGRKNHGKLQAVDLSRDHNPSDPDEKRRIEALKGRIHQTLVPVGGSDRGFIPMGPERVWDKSGMCGLGVSRSLGDLHMAPFVSQLPEITQKKLDSNDRMVILASDGVWTQMTSQQAVDIAGKHSSPTKAAQEITQVCRQRWLHETGSRMCDDITAVVVNLDRAEGGPEGSTSWSRAGDTRPPSSSADLRGRSSTNPRRISR
jgi:serine/threonine protein phosphatase PrpC